MRSITIPLQGGLGNQLFQLTAGLVLTERLGVHVRFADYWLERPAEGETERQLGIGALLAPGELSRQAVPRTGGYTDRVLNHRVVERSPDDDALARVGRFTRTVAGYFQRLGYVDEAWPSLRQRLLGSRDPRVTALASPTEGEHGAIHYRLGDYATNQQARAGLGLTAPGYFLTAMREAQEATGVRRWLVISDEPTRAVRLLRNSGLPTGIEISSPGSGGEWDDLATMASARVCVVSNSSFSWWGAYLGWRAKSNLVVAPSPWFADSSQHEPPLFPLTWERRPRSLL